MENQPVSPAPATPEQTVPAPAPAKRTSLSMMFGLGILGVVVVGLIGGYFVVVQRTHALSQNAMVVKLADVFHIPAASVNGKDVLYTDYNTDIETLKKFYAQNPQALGVAPTEEQISDQVLSRLLANALISMLAKQYNVTVADADVEAAKAQLLAGFPDQAAAEQELKDQYGWTIDTYMNRVVKPVLLEEALQKAFSHGTDEAGKMYEVAGETDVRARHILFRVDNNEAGKKDAAQADEVKKQAEDVLKRALAGEDFAALAQQFGSDGTKDLGGDLGWFGKGDMVPEFEEAVYSLQPGQVGPTLVETMYGYHIVKLEEKATPRDFGKFMDDQLRAATIKIYINTHNPFENAAASGSNPEAISSDAVSE